MSFQITVPAGPAAPATVRHALLDWLSPRASNGLLTDAPLVVSELVTNSLRHGGLPDAATVRVSADLINGVLRLEVEDAGTAGAVTQRVPNRNHGGGFGLNIIDALAARWGVRRDRGTLVWVELPIPHPTTA
jgi:anti-sigma regulatory factor (Ser/Thr protein kinase)